MPGFSPTQEQGRQLVAYNVGYNFEIRMPDAPKDMTEEQERKYRPKPGKVFCNIIDRATGQVYIRESGADETVAFVTAFEKISTTPKPLTRAQQLVAENLSARDKAIADKDAEIAALRAQLAGQPAPAPDQQTPKRKAGRPRKNLAEPSEVAAS